MAGVAVARPGRAGPSSRRIRSALPHRVPGPVRGPDRREKRIVRATEKEGRRREAMKMPPSGRTQPIRCVERRTPAVELYQSNRVSIRFQRGSSGVTRRQALRDHQKTVDPVSFFRGTGVSPVGDLTQARRLCYGKRAGHSSGVKPRAGTRPTASGHRVRSAASRRLVSGPCRSGKE